LFEEDACEGDGDDAEAEPGESLAGGDMEVVGVEGDGVGVDDRIDGQASEDGEYDHGDGEAQCDAASVELAEDAEGGDVAGRSCDEEGDGCAGGQAREQEGGCERCGT